MEEKAIGLNHYVTHFLTGHGSFKAYLPKIGKVAESNCDRCLDVKSTVQPVLTCPKWKIENEKHEAIPDQRLTVNDFATNVKANECAA